MLGERKYYFDSKRSVAGRLFMRAMFVVCICMVVATAGVGVSLSAGTRGGRSSHVLRTGSRSRRMRSSSSRAALARLMRQEKAWAARRRRWLDSPREQSLRAVSQMEFDGLSAGSAQRLLMDDYGSALRGVSSNPAVSIARDGSLVRYLSNYRAVVRTAKGLELETSTVPLRVGHGNGTRGPVSLRMRRTGDSFTAVNPLRPVSVSRRLNGGATVGGDGLGLIPLGTDVSGSLLGGERVFFADVAHDTDAVIEPTIDGADFSTVLRSRLSPETIAYRVVLPAGATLQASNGGAAIFRGGQVIAHVPAPTARDAQGTKVPVRMRVVGDNLVLSVAHRSQEFAYPVLVDPELLQGIDSHSTNWGFYTESSGSGVAYCEGEAGPTREASTSPCSGSSQFTHSVGGGSLNITMSPATVPFQIFEGEEVYEVRGGAAELYWKSYIHSPTESVEFDDISSSEGSFDIEACDQSRGWGEAEAPSWVRFTKVRRHNCQYEPVVVKMFNQGGGSYVEVKSKEWVLEGGTATIGGSISVGAIVVGTLMSSTDREHIEAEELGTENKSEPNRSHCFIGYPVNCATGNQVETQTDFTVGGSGLGLSLIRTYNSQLADKQSTPGSFGYGWSDSFGTRLTTSLPCPEYLSMEPMEEGEEINGLLVGDCKQAAQVEQGNGSTAMFIQNEAGTWLPLDRQNEAKLTHEESGYVYTLPYRTVQRFNNEGLLTSETDHNGHKLTMSRNSKGQIETVTDSAGREVTFTYDSGGQVESATDPMGNSVKYTYESGNLLSVTEPGESSPRWQFKYNADHELTEMTDGRGGTVMTEYKNKRVTSQTDAIGRKRTWTYEFPSTGPETIIKEPNGAKTCEQFNGSGEPVSVTHACGTTEKQTISNYYDENGNLAEKVDPNGHKTTYTYNEAGDRTSETDALGHKTEWTYNTTHEVISTKDPSGEITTIERDSKGNPETISREAPGSETQTTSYTYDSHGNVESVTSPLSDTWKYEYDSYGDKISETDPEGNKRTWTYNADSRETSTTSPRGNIFGAEPSKFTTTIERDAQGRPVTVTEPEPTGGGREPVEERPSNTSLPEISGETQEGQTLSANTGSWDGTMPLTYSYQWQGCEALSTSCFDIPGATGSTHLLGAGDVGSTVRVVVTAINPGGSENSISEATGIISGIVHQAHSTLHNSARKDRQLESWQARLI